MCRNRLTLLALATTLSLLVPALSTAQVAQVGRASANPATLSLPVPTRSPVRVSTPAQDRQRLDAWTKACSASWKPLPNRLLAFTSSAGLLTLPSSVVAQRRSS